MTTQLRTLTIQDGKMEDFIAAWRVTVYPLRTQYGFVTLGAWVVAEANQFLWLMRYDGPEGFEAANRAYHAAPERLALRPDPAQYIVKAVVQDVTPVV